MNRWFVRQLMAWHKWRIACADGALVHNIMRLDRLGEVHFRQTMRGLVKARRRR